MTQPRIAMPFGAQSFAEAGVAYEPAVTAALGRHYGAATQLSLDPVLTEVVRLRCARTHQCRICKTLRLRSAHEAGVDEQAAAEVDHYETSTFPERVKVALRYTDAYLSRPGEITQTLADQVAETFTLAEVVALTMHIMKWSTQKMMVALALDQKPGVDTDSGDVTYFEFDGAGRSTNFVAAADELHAAERPLHPIQ